MSYLRKRIASMPCRTILSSVTSSRRPSGKVAYRLEEEELSRVKAGESAGQ